MAESKPVNIGIVIIGIGVLLGIISLFYFDQSQNLILKTNTTINNTESKEKIINNTEILNKNYTVIILNNSFSPKEITIKRGDTVYWINKDNSAHSITSDSGTELGSRVLLKDDSYNHKFNFDGIYNYYSNFNQNLKGKVIVEI